MPPGEGDRNKIRVRDLTPCTQRALRETTGQKFEKAEDWKDWWSKNRATFKEP